MFTRRIVPHVVALALVASVTWMRLSLDPVLGDRALAIFFVLPPLTAALLVGYGPTYTATLGSLVALGVFFIVPRASASGATATDFILLAIVGLASAGIGRLVWRLRHAEREQRTLALATSEQRQELQALLDVAPVGVAIAHDPECRTITAGGWFGALLGVGPDDNISKTGVRADRLPYAVSANGIEIPAADLPMQRAARTGEVVWNHEYDLVVRDDRKLHFLVNAAPLFHADGSVRGAIGIHVDITERKRVEEALEATLSRLHAHFDNSPIAFVAWNAETRIIFWNAGAERMFGWTSGEALGKHIDDLPLVHEDDREDVATIMADMLVHVRPQNLHRNRNRRRDGAIIECEWYNSALYDASGRLTSVLSQVLDVTDRKRDESARKFLLDVAQTLGASLASEEALRRLTRMPLERYAEWCVLDLVTPEGAIERAAVAHRDPQKHELLQTYAGRYPVSWDSETGEVLRSGQPRLIGTVPPPLVERVAGGDPDRLAMLTTLDAGSSISVPVRVGQSVLGVYHWVRSSRENPFDETELRLAEAVATQAANALRHAALYEEALRANQVKDEFLATLSHELRTPLNAIMGWTRLLRSGHLDAASTRRAYETLERNAAAQTQLIGDVLDISRIVAGKFRLEPRVVQLPNVVEAAAEVVRPTAAAKQIELGMRVEPGLPPMIADPDRLQQMVWNLLTNAVKFTPRAGRVELAVRAGDGEVEIAVSDTGIGIAPGFLPHVFERFRQADASANREHGGLGLGLALVKHLAEAHGGSVAVESAGLDQGATFRVRLPVRAAEPVTGTRVIREPIEPASPDPVGRLDGVRVLLVEDDVDALGVLEQVLDRAGADVRATTSAEAAFDLLGQWTPHAILSDIGLPRTDGYEFIRRLRASMLEARDVPAAALTAYARPEDRARALEEGYQLHLVKPVEHRDLVGAVLRLAPRGLQPTR